MTKLRAILPALLFACSSALAQSGPGWVDPPTQIPPPAPAAPAPAAPAPAAPAPAPAEVSRAPSPATAAPRPEATRPQAAPRTEVTRAPIETRRRAAAEIRRSRAAEAPRPRAIVRAPAPEPQYEPAPQVRLEGGGASPSFDCRYAGTAVERAICSDPDLAAKDRIMASLYEKVGGSRRGPVDPTQWRWLAARNGCGRLPGGSLYNCVHRRYDARIAELSGWLR